MALLYPAALLAISLLVFLLEASFPWRKEQKQLRRGLLSDLAHLVFNGHFLGVILFGLAHQLLLPALDGLSAATGFAPASVAFAASWPLWLQIGVALVAIDFLQWLVHVLLHRVSFLWTFHQTHHSVVDGEMDWIVSFRFHWMEIVVYRSLLYVPLALLGFAPEAVMVHAIFGTLIGHLNHANLAWDYGPLRYVLNNPKMHLWHHDFDGDGKTTKNFGIIFSVWDWIFGTASMPGRPPARLGYAGVEDHPKDFLSQAVWPLSGKITGKLRPVAMALGATLLAAGWWWSAPRATSAALAAPAAPAERASSQPSTGRRVVADPALVDPALVDPAIARFGLEAAEAGYAHPEVMVSAGELAAAAGSSRLAILDVRPKKRFEEGHLPGAQLVERADFEVEEHGTTLSAGRETLEALLRARGVRRDQVVVLYGDGPEPYRLWWTLRTVGGIRTRVLDGGIVAWKAAGLETHAGAADPLPPGDVALAGVHGRAPQRWPELHAALGAEQPIYLDARSPDEYDGSEKHRDAARAGHIPGAVSLPWNELLRDDAEDPRLLPPAALRERLAALDIRGDRPVVTYCQTGTRSSVAYFALHQLGFSVEDVLNYEGSWAEYSQLDPSATGVTP